MENNLYDTVIIGAGPIGSFLAYKLALNKHRVLVVEKKESVETKICCTGIISKECLQELSLDNEIIVRKANAATFFAPSGRCLRFRRNDEIAYITDRPLLNRKLVNKAKEAGAEYRYFTRTTDIKQNDSRLLVQADCPDGETEFNTRSAVIAAGYGTNLIGRLGFNQIRQYSISAQVEVELADVTEVEIYADNTISPGGFSWLVPTRDGKGLAGFLGKVNHQPELHLKNLLAKLKAKGKIISDDAAGDFAVIPLQPLSKTYGERLLIVGEAAGQVKPITGGGIYYGIICAGIAGDVLHQALTADKLSVQNLRVYQKLWRAKLGREIAISYLAQRIWSKMNNKHIEYAFNILQSKHIPELVANTSNFSFDWHSKLLWQMTQSFLPFAGLQKRL